MGNKLYTDLACVSPGNQDKVNALFSVLVFRNMINCPKRVQNEIPQSSFEKMRSRHSNLIMSTKEPCVDMILKVNLSDIVTAVSQDLFRIFGSTKHLLQAAIDRKHTFDSCLIKSLEKDLGLKNTKQVNAFDLINPMKEPPNPNAVFLALLIRNVINSSKTAGKSLPSGSLQTIVERLYQLITLKNRIVSAINSALDRISRDFLNLSARWQWDFLPTVVQRENTTFGNNQEVGNKT
ncbi:uncharacterized protein LOC119783316 [Cyprinodon tularosa]|uniref:uncharacterized protein LOC119783316 n=1 Tax=Cyprinodon tularosa TaxID=77115 RepID=UPI0018E27629|nr:uncharacterized protein LOC119783316 [Cyprinodon tularosa]